ncbi:MAG: peptidylprolyl isomerase [Eubacteriales bacterium]|nr:peptidylprolyl isomerase [Eubacteriales bacterium]
MKKLISVILTAVFCLTLFSCAGEKDEASKTESAENSYSEDLKGINFNIEGNETTLENYETSNPVAAIYVKDYGVIVVELYPETAPNTVNNFISLIKKGFYDNNTIHRMLPGFVIQGGDPNGTGSGGPGYTIAGEFTINGFENNLKHTAGVLSMARAPGYDTAGSQFFIMLDDNTGLDTKYASFGKVIDGFDVCEEIEKIRYYNTTTGKLVDNLTIVKMVVDTKGVSYPEPEIIK